MDTRPLLIPVFPTLTGVIPTASAKVRPIASCEVSMVIALRRPGEALETDWTWGMSATPFGACTMIWCGSALAYLGFPTADTVEDWFQLIQERWSLQSLDRHDSRAESVAGELFYGKDQQEPLNIQLDGSAFQIAVWDALLTVPAGTTTTYAALAEAIDRPSAIRACANAVGDNPIAWLFPCHRVVRKDGSLGGYRWGEELKSNMLVAEASTLKI